MGRTLLAHELTHAATAAPGAPTPTGRLRVSSPEEYAEVHAVRRARDAGADGAPTAAASGPTALMRDLDEEGGDIGRGDSAVPLGTGTSGVLKDDLKQTDTSVSIGGIHAADWNDNVKAKLGGDGGKVEVKVDTTTPSVNAAGTIDGLTYSATITKTTATLDSSQFTAPSEITAAQALATALQRHEQRHKDKEVSGRTGFAATMKGKPESSLDAALKAVECKVSNAQRTLDNAEGLTTLNANNTVSQSGIDYPEYEDPCKP